MFFLAVFNTQTGFFDVKLMMTFTRNTYSFQTYMNNNVCTISIPSRKCPVIVFYLFKEYLFFRIIIYYILYGTRPTNQCDFFLGKSLIKI